MTQVSEFETTNDWRSLLQIKENGVSSAQADWNIIPVMEEAAWLSYHLNNPVTFPIPDETMEARQAFREDTSFAGIARWGSVFGLLDTPETSNPAAVHVAMPSDDWSWCADPALTPVIRLKKRMAILNVFDG